ncbi:MAG TPA: preprotein translocase subunit SecE [Candidatus Saccharimonadales bacterium]|nr:preprotein translocase subunit SecE [Candidatus Saccharimonadales bacterium]
MAEKPTRQIKRKVRNPESFRERASKAGNEKKKNSYLSSFFKALLFPFRWLARKIKSFFRLNVFKPFRRPARIIGKIIFPSYFRQSFQELKLVTWPGWKQSRQLTFAVLVFAIVFGAAIAGVDWGLDKVFKNVLLK